MLVLLLNFWRGTGKTPVEGQGLTRAADAWQFNRIGMQEFGQDILLEYEKAQELQWSAVSKKNEQIMNVFEDYESAKHAVIWYQRSQII